MPRIDDTVSSTPRQIPSDLSEVRPEEQAFILLEQMRWQWCQWAALLYATPVFERR